MDYTIDSGKVEYQTLNGNSDGQRYWWADSGNHSNEVYDLARNSTEHGIGGIVGYAQNCQFLAVSMKANVKNNDSGISGVVGAMIGYGTDNTIDQCYAKPTTGSNVTETLANGNNTSSHVYISGHYSDDENTRRSLTDIWMQLNGEWVLKIFYW